METSKLIKHLRLCGSDKSYCPECERYGEMVIDGDIEACTLDLMQKAANAIEALQAELRDEMHRHDRLQDFEVEEAAQLAEAKETAVMLRKKWQAATNIICAHCTECKCETHDDVLVMQKKCDNLTGFPDCGMFTSQNAVELIRVKAERDAMEAELKHDKGCAGCVHCDTEWCEEPCDSCRQDPKFPAWKWRGRS